ncbi:unnamed protein product [Prunus armeniaca]
MRHVLDVMHIEKNVGDSIIGTLLEIPGKNKDGIAAQLDLLNMGVKTDMQPEYGESRTRLPTRPWNLSRAEKRAKWHAHTQKEVDLLTTNGFQANGKLYKVKPKIVLARIHAVPWKEIKQVMLGTQPMVVPTVDVPGLVAEGETKYRRLCSDKRPQHKGDRIL